MSVEERDRAILQAVREAVSGPSLPDVTPGRKVSYSLSKDIPADTDRDSPAEKELEMDFGGVFRDPLIAWPGVQGGTGIRLEGDDGSKLFPYNDDPEDDFESMVTTHADRVEMRHEVEQGDVITAKFVNFDAGNNHIINCLPVLEEV